MADLEKVIVKSNRNGLIVILDKDTSFDVLKKHVSEKFKESKKFFKGAEMAVAFEGKLLTMDEQLSLIKEMELSANIKVPCIVDMNKEREMLMKQALENTKPKANVSFDPNGCTDGKFYKGTLRSGQVLVSDTSIIVLGDVNPGATLRSKGNVIVLGTLKGTVEVGTDGNENAFVAALGMDPMQIRIAHLIARNSNENKSKMKKEKKVDEPMIAYVADGNIYVEELTKEALVNIRL